MEKRHTSKSYMVESFNPCLQCHVQHLHLHISYVHNSSLIGASKFHRVDILSLSSLSMSVTDMSILNGFRLVFLIL